MQASRYQQNQFLQGRKDFKERKIDFCILKYAKMIIICVFIKWNVFWNEKIGFYG